MKLHWKVWHQALPRKCETRMELTNALAYYVVVKTTTKKSFFYHRPKWRFLKEPALNQYLILFLYGFNLVRNTLAYLKITECLFFFLFRHPSLP
jgi:hypothetical protein